MTDTHRALRTAADTLLRDLDALIALKDGKCSLAIDDPRLPDLNQQVDEIATLASQATWKLLPS